MLPEQKKTPEEIIALRGKLGIAGAAANTEATDENVDVKPLTKLEPEPPARIVTSPEPVPESVIDPITGLPEQRHTDDELERIRLRGMFETQDEALHLPVRRERTLIVIGGYLFAMSAAIPVYHNLPMIVPTGIALVSLAFCAYLFFMRPYSKHHGAFIGIVVLFVLTYAALQYFPQLRHAT